jgi:hypothetical protein
VLIVKADADRKFFTRHGLHMNNIGKEKTACEVSTVIKNSFQKRNMKNKSVSDNLTGGTTPLQEDSKTDQITLENTEIPIDTPNLTEDSIPLQDDSKTEQTTLENMETPTDTLSSDEGPRTSKRKKKTPYNRK